MSVCQDCGGDCDAILKALAERQPVTPQEIVDLLGDLPPIRTGFANEADRNAWLDRKRRLIARIDAE